MLGRRLRQLRLARGLSMDQFVAAMGGVVTKQALSKYERDLARPRQAVLRSIAKALEVSTARLIEADPIQVDIRAYRRKARMGRKEMERIENLTAIHLEDRVRLEDVLGLTPDARSVPQIPVGRVADAEDAAAKVRADWGLGEDPIASVIDTFEEHHIHVIEVESSDAFDGISAVARGRRGRVLGAAVVIRKGLPGERQRLSLTHELGHLVLQLAEGVEEERAAFRFGAAMLAPAEPVRRDVGSHRRHVDLQELLLLKRRYGMSVQALLYRLRDLGIISEGQYKSGCVDINRMGWRRGEPMALEPEQPTWLRQNVLRAVSEGVLSTREGEQILGGAAPKEPPPSLVGRRVLVAMPAEERRRHLKEQADRIAGEYQPDSDWQALGGEKVVEY